MYKIFVAVRYLRRNWLNLVGVGAVAIGVLVLICVLSVMKAWDEEFRERIRATLSDLIVESWGDESFGGYVELMDRIERLPHVVACAPHFEGLALIKLGRGKNQPQRYGQYHGVDLKREIRATEFAEYWRAGRGREARDRVSELVSDNAPELAVVGKERVVEILARMRTQDFEQLEKAERRAIETWAQERGVDLQALFGEADRARPEWGAVEQPERYSPTFVGAELAVVGRDLERNLIRLGIDDEIVVFAATDSIENPANIRPCRIRGNFRSGMFEYDERNLYLPLADVQRFMDKDEPPEVTSINIRLDSFENAPLVRAMLLGILTADEIEEGLALVGPLMGAGNEAALGELEGQVKKLRREGPRAFAEGDWHVVVWSGRAQVALDGLIARTLAGVGGEREKQNRVEKLRAFQERLEARVKNSIGPHFRISTWEDKRRTFLRAVQLERRIMGVILFFVILVAGFLILSILHTTVVAKTRDIGILKSIGGSVGGIMSIFLLNGLLMGVIGSALGVGGGLLITRNINEIEGFLDRLFGFRVFPSDIYYLDKLPVDKEPFWSTVAICATAIAVSFLASAYPAWKASRMDPVEALRYE